METMLSEASFATRCTSLSGALLMDVSSCSIVAAFSNIPSSGQSSSDLLHEDSSCDASPANLTTL